MLRYWMGVAHLLSVERTVADLASLGPNTPMLQPEQVLFFANANVEPFEQRLIEDLRITEVRLPEVIADPAGAAATGVRGWARRFGRLLVHLDLDVLDFADMPLAENTRRNVSLQFHHLMASLRMFLAAPNWAALTIAELNPDHGESDGSTLRTFADGSADALAVSPRW
jgi:arginase